MDQFLLIGIIGMAIILIAFLFNQMKIWNSDNAWYDFSNLVGALMLLAYAWEAAAWPFVVLNGVWAIYSLKDVLKALTTPAKQ